MLRLPRGLEAEGRAAARHGGPHEEGGRQRAGDRAGESDESLIIDAVTGRDGWRMPPESEGSPLSADEIAAIKAWIDQGAKSPADERPQPDPRRPLVVSAA